LTGTRSRSLPRDRGRRGSAEGFHRPLVPSLPLNPRIFRSPMKSPCRAPCPPPRRALENAPSPPCSRPPGHRCGSGRRRRAQESGWSERGGYPQARPPHGRLRARSFTARSIRSGLSWVGQGEDVGNRAGAAVRPCHAAGCMKSGATPARFNITFLPQRSKPISRSCLCGQRGLWHLRCCRMARSSGTRESRRWRWVNVQKPRHYTMNGCSGS